MARFVIKLQDQKNTWYLVWSTVVDAPITIGMTSGELRKWWKKEYGDHELIDFDARIMPHVKAYGHSATYHKGSVEDLITPNRAGPEESNIGISEIINHYCKR